MPLVAKLSQKFFDQFGEDVVAELISWFNQMDAAYHAQLRELNDLNFARFDAKLEQRLAEQSATIDRRFAEFETKFERGLAGLRSDMDRRFTEFEVKFERGLAEMRSEMDRRFRELEVKFETKFERGFAELRVEIAKSETRIVRWMVGLWIGQTLIFATFWLQTR